MNLKILTLMLVGTMLIGTMIFGIWRLGGKPEDSTMDNHNTTLGGMNTFSGKYLTFTYPADWELWSDMKSIESADHILIELTRSLGGEQIQVIDFSIALKATQAVPTSPEELLFVEQATIQNEISRRDIMVNGVLKGEGIEIVGEQIGGISTITMRALEYKLSRPIKGPLGFMYDAVLVSGYTGTTYNGEQILTPNEEAQVQEFLKSISVPTQ